MSEITFYILKGLFYGYSKEAIHAFLMRRCDIDSGRGTDESPSSLGTHLEDTGLIPSARELAMTLEEVTLDVNSRRICSAPFPGGDLFSHEFDAFIENPPADTEDRVFEVLKYIQENTYESYLRANAERRGRSELPAGRLEESSPDAGVPRH